MTEQFTIRPKGPFSLEEAANFGFGQRLDTKWDGVLRFAFCVDGYREQVGVEIRQEDLDVDCVMHGDLPKRRALRNRASPIIMNARAARSPASRAKYRA